MGLRLRFYVLWPRFKNAASELFFRSDLQNLQVIKEGNLNLVMKMEEQKLGK